MILRNIFLGIGAFIFLEIYVGLAAIREYGFGNVFFACLAAFILGVGLFRTSSLRLTVGVAQAMNQGKPPGLAALDGALIGLAGVLFIIPGFVSDAIALLLLIPPLRRFAAKRLVRLVSVRQAVGNQGGYGAARDVGRSSRTERASYVNAEARPNPNSDASSAIIDVDAVIVEDKPVPGKN